MICEKRKAVLLFVLMIPCLAIGVPTPLHASVLLSDDFESYAIGSWPSSWVKDANAHDSSRNRIVADPAGGDNQSLKMYGAVSGCWGALAYNPVEFTSTFSMQARIYNGSENSTSCHQYRGAISMRQGTSWTNPARSLLCFNRDGTINGLNGLLPGTYQTDRWYDVRIDYNRNGSSLDMKYWIGGNFIDSRHTTITDLNRELSLDHLELVAATGSAYFDNIQVRTLRSGNDLPQQPQPDPISVPAGNNLVLFTHGWNTTQSNWDSGDWNTLRSALNAAVDGSEWEVLGHDWTELSGNLFTGPGTAINNAATEGSSIGGEIGRQHYDHVHLIAHSAGANLISKAAEVIKARSPSTKIHMTFLDPFSFLPARLESYGENSDWAENYSSQDWTAGDTYLQLPHTHNVDVSTYGNSHSTPVEFYTQSVIDYINGVDDPARGDYGFQRSLEADGWSTSNPTNYRPGEDWVVLDGGTAGNSDDISLRIDLAQDFEDIPFAKSETVQVVGTTIEMPTASPAWISMFLDVTDPVNFITFDAEFLSEAGAEGLLAMYWDGEVVSTIDERYALPGNQNYTMWLSGTMEPGMYELAFRLDPFTEVQSRIMLDNIQTGFAAVPEPSTFLLLAMGALGLLVVARRRRSREH